MTSEMLSLKNKKEKINVFRTLFKGREDVFAKYWISYKTGKEGYSPVCKNEWIPQVCRKPCEKCGNKDYIPLNDSWIEKHLLGEIIIGVYPIQLDDRVNFLVFDFDKENSFKNAVKLMNFCLSVNLPAYLERSKSGYGTHLWIFLSQPISAAKVRNFAFKILEKANITLLNREKSGFDRIFPNQDFLQDGGLGNLIALPLQYHAAQKGNTLFLDVDNGYCPYQDQWHLLKNIKKIDEIVIEKFLKGPSSNTFLKGQTINIAVSNYISIPVEDTNREFYQFLRKNLVIHNPIFYEKKAKGFSTWNTSKMIYCLHSKDGNYIIPRGFLKSIENFLLQNSKSFQIDDVSILTPPKAFKCQLKIYDYQKKALNDILKNNNGILEAPPGYGKTIIALATLPYRKQRTLIIVHTKELLTQWIQKIEDVLGIKKEEIGIIGGGKEKIGKKITVATYQSLVRKNLKTLVDNIGYVMVDECHRVPANTFQKVVKKFKSRYLLGLTATPFRKDKLQKLMFLYLGEIIHRIDPARISDEFKNATSILVIRSTNYYPAFEIVKKYKDIIEMLTRDGERNELIVKDIINEYSLDKNILILTGRKDHCTEISRRLSKQVKHSILTGNLSLKERKEILRNFKNRKIRLLIATSQLLGEGVDLPSLDTLFLVFPTTSKAKLIQYIGRVQRKNKDKPISKIYDYHDQFVSILNMMFLKRKKIYKKLGIKQINQGDTI